MGFTKGFSEIVLVVGDVPASAAFYRDVVGLVPNTEADENWAWFWSGAPNASARLGLHKGTLLFEEHSRLPEGKRFGPVHCAFQVEFAELEAAKALVESKGIAVYGPTFFDWMQAKSYYFYDPDQNLLEFWAAQPLS